MKAFKEIIKCKVFGVHTLVFKTGYGYRCSCCGKTKAGIHRGQKYG